jgi:hypothetical protein
LYCSTFDRSWWPRERSAAAHLVSALDFPSRDDRWWLRLWPWSGLLGSLLATGRGEALLWLAAMAVVAPAPPRASTVTATAAIFGMIFMTVTFLGAPVDRAHPACDVDHLMPV